MIKYLLIVFNSFILFLFGIFNTDNGITISSTIPDTMVAGRDVPIEITLTKGDLSGFAKLQMELPTGFTVKEAEEKGATYTFREGIAKWVWAVLPSENEFTIKLILRPTTESIGLRTITAKYSFVQNNVKQVVEMKPVQVSVLAESEGGNEQVSVAAASTETLSAAVSPTSVTPPSTASSIAVSPNTAPSIAVSPNTVSPIAVTPGSVASAAMLPPKVTSNREKPGAIYLLRSVNKLSATEYEVQISIVKGSTKGFARYSDVLPQDVVIKSGKTGGASYSLADGKIKFVWVNVPDKDSLMVSYIISSKRSQTIELIGEYTYLEDNQSKKKEIEIQSLSFETPLGNEKGLDAGSDARKETAVVNEKKKETKSQKKTPETKPVIAEPLQKSAAAPRKEKEKGTNKKKLQTGSPETSVANAGGMLYQVQVGAFAKKMVTTEKLEKRFKIIETINSEMSGGYTKFMVGNHREYKEARDHREKIIDENKIKSSFVVAYNDGKRITVQEALSITNQKWFK